MINNNILMKGNKNMLTTIFDDMNNMFKRMDAMMNYPLSSLGNRGLKNIIHRPHNLITKKDENGNVIGYSIEVVYTPFKRDEVAVEVLDNVLTVRCGNENREKDESMDYCGISRQTYEFSIPLAETIDHQSISAKAEDGILYIDLPMKKIEEKKSVPLTIEVK